MSWLLSRQVVQVDVRYDVDSFDRPREDVSLLPVSLTVSRRRCYGGYEAGGDSNMGRGRCSQ
jgi:hypothetical protein